MRLGSSRFVALGAMLAAYSEEVHKGVIKTFLKEHEQKKPAPVKQSKAERKRARRAAAVAREVARKGVLRVNDQGDPGDSDVRTL